MWGSSSLGELVGRGSGGGDCERRGERQRQGERQTQTERQTKADAETGNLRLWQLQFWGSAKTTSFSGSKLPRRVRGCATERRTLSTGL